MSFPTTQISVVDLQMLTGHEVLVEVLGEGMWFQVQVNFKHK